MEIRLHRELADFVALAGPMYRAAASALVDHDPGLDKVFGPRARAEAFAEAWCAATGADP